MTQQRSIQTVNTNNDIPPEEEMIHLQRRRRTRPATKTASKTGKEGAADTTVKRRPRRPRPTHTFAAATRDDGPQRTDGCQRLVWATTLFKVRIGGERTKDSKRPKRQTKRQRKTTNTFAMHDQNCTYIAVLTNAILRRGTSPQQKRPPCTPGCKLHC